MLFAALKNGCGCVKRLGLHVVIVGKRHESLAGVLLLVFDRSRCIECNLSTTAERFKLSRRYDRGDGFDPDPAL